MFAAFDKHLVSAPFLDHCQNEARAKVADAQLIVHGLTSNAGVQPVHEIIVDNGGFVAATVDVDVAETKVAGNLVHCLFQGSIDNAEEICQLYGLQIETLKDLMGKMDYARLMLALYLEGFSDEYGDFSDQPATLLGSLQGDFAFLIYDGVTRYLLIARSPSGLMPLYWGMDDSDTNLVMSSEKAYLSPFPPGCAYESQAAADQLPPLSHLTNYTRHTPRTRDVQTLTEVDSHGHLCGLRYKTKSGKDLAGPQQTEVM